ncbi:cobyric acid synthase [Actibacterium sp. 188UL27-1]|uniref:cobyric acid synthase n=1 Tax=Actibacterium sp. 188UL27-1 TaxID=2786961 RepID=UPI0019561E44|nr:cobyric acid synthase [Actibacterium sp. 188UL27-1]MBM7068271.1 cobyric acid synthase [Actibacterium sp. 188UL27-1]
MTKAIMIQGAGSNVGKSILVAGLCRHFARQGLQVRPFKPQNMSNNAAVTPEGAEIGRAQALQAKAAGVAPHVDMNPVLLKPESEVGAQVILQGKRFATLKARDYATAKPQLLASVLESFHRLAEGVDLVVVEGAGSPAEINLRAGDIANMGFAEAADLPVVLVGDIDRGGVIAQLVGTQAVLPAQDARRIKAFLVNKFRGDPTLFADGQSAISQRTGWHDLGVLPWFDGAWKLPAEDILDLSSRAGGKIKVVVPKLPRLANFDDLDPLAQEPDVTVAIVPLDHALPGDATLVLLPGSKSTISDLEALRRSGWDIDVAAHLRRGGHVLGLCGGYQMLGQRIDDPLGIEGQGGTVPGLGLLDVTTRMVPEKQVVLTAAHHPASGTDVEGYEIHIGETTGPDRARGWLQMNGQSEGAASADGRILGTYLHGIFAADGFRRAFLNELGAASSDLQYDMTVEATLDALANHMAAHLDLEGLLACATDLPVSAR